MTWNNVYIKMLGFRVPSTYYPLGYHVLGVIKPIDPSRSFNHGSSIRNSVLIYSSQNKASLSIVFVELPDLGRNGIGPEG